MYGNELRSTVEQSTNLAIIRLSGVLNGLTAPTLRAAVHKSLAEEPAVVAVDMSAVTEVDDLGLMIFPALARAAAAWPGARLVLFCTQPRTVRRLQAISMGHLWTFVESEKDARAVVAQDEGPPMLREALPSGPAAVTLARELVRRICTASPVEDLTDDAELVVSELVSNATVHARPPVALTVTRRPAYLHIAVRDGSRDEPRLGGRNAGTEHRDGGRGLLVVDALCVAWGCTPLADGKVVWATMRYT